MNGQYNPAGAPNTGSVFVKWLTEHHPTPVATLLHSQNPVGRQFMRQWLEANGWEEIMDFPFSPRYVEYLRKTFGEAK